MSVTLESLPCELLYMILSNINLDEFHQCRLAAKNFFSNLLKDDASLHHTIKNSSLEQLKAWADDESSIANYISTVLRQKNKFSRSYQQFIATIFEFDTFATIVYKGLRSYHTSGSTSYENHNALVQDFVLKYKATLEDNEQSAIFYKSINSISSELLDSFIVWITQTGYPLTITDVLNSESRGYDSPKEISCALETWQKSIKKSVLRFSCDEKLGYSLLSDTFIAYFLQYNENTLIALAKSYSGFIEWILKNEPLRSHFLQKIEADGFFLLDIMAKNPETDRICLEDDKVFEILQASTSSNDMGLLEYYAKKYSCHVILERIFQHLPYTTTYYRKFLCLLLPMSNRILELEVYEHEKSYAIKLIQDVSASLTNPKSDIQTFDNSFEENKYFTTHIKDAIALRKNMKNIIEALEEVLPLKTALEIFHLSEKEIDCLLSDQTDERDYSSFFYFDY